MANPWFQFKQFTVWHDKCGMKVGTDGVLLGAWVNAFGPLTVLDIGAGTGLIALMLAQKVTRQVDAVEIENDASIQAGENFEKSPWADRLKIYNTSAAEFRDNCKKQYDLIVSNPPYFTSEHKAPDVKRAMARHAGELKLSDLVSISSDLLNTDGRLAVILPIELRNEFISEIGKYNFWIIRETKVKADPLKSPFRVLLEVSKLKNKIKKTDELVIRESPGGAYTNKFRQITREFYLDF